MKVRLDLGVFRQTTWWEYAVRFLFGGFVTAAAGLIADKYGPGIGGLFLAFPAIFPATATLLEKHEREKKERAGYSCGNRARHAVSLDAFGAALGGMGLLAFATMVAGFITRHNPWMVLGASSLAWLGVSIGVWRARKLPRKLTHKLRKQRA